MSSNEKKAQLLGVVAVAAYIGALYLSAKAQNKGGRERVIEAKKRYDEARSELKEAAASANADQVISKAKEEKAATEAAEIDALIESAGATLN